MAMERLLPNNPGTVIFPVPDGPWEIAPSSSFSETPREAAQKPNIGTLSVERGPEGAGANRWDHSVTGPPARCSGTIDEKDLSPLSLGPGLDNSGA